MAGYRPPMYGIRRGRPRPRVANVSVPQAPAAKVEEVKEVKEEKPKPKPKPAAKKVETKAKAKAKAKPKKVEAKAKPKAKRLKRWRKSDTKDDLYWLAQTLGIEKIKTRTPKDDMIKILRRHPGAEEIKD